MLKNKNKSCNEILIHYWIYYKMLKLNSFNLAPISICKLGSKIYPVINYKHCKLVPVEENLIQLMNIFMCHSHSILIVTS